MKKFHKFHWVIAFLVYTLAVFFITYPLIFNLGLFITGFGDELLIAWIHNWVLHSLITNPLDIFNANIYYPYNNTLAYSDTFFLTSLLSLIPLQIWQQPIVVVNITIISSLIFLGISVYLLSHHITQNKATSLISGLLVIFSPAVLDKLVHIQILAIALVPLAILFFLQYLQKRKTKFFVFALICFVLQTSNSMLPGYFIAFSFVIIFLLYFIQNKKNAIALITRNNVVLVLASILLLLPIILPYYAVSREFNYVRDIRDTIHLALQPEDFFYTNSYSRFEPISSYLQPKEYDRFNEYKPGFIGLVFSLLVIISIIFFVKNFSKKNWVNNALLSIGGFGLIMSLGPFLHLFRNTIHSPFPIPLPYVLFFYVIPGFQGIRNSSRWEMLFVVAAAVVVAVALHQLLKKVDLQKRVFVYIVLIFGIIAEFNFPIQFQKIQQKEDFPTVYHWLNTTPKESVIIEMPIYTWDMQPYVMDENMREYYATTHFRKMVNGASGYSPQPWQDTVRKLLVAFPSESSVKQLKDMHVNYIIVHKTEYDRLFMDKYAINKRTLPSGQEVINNMNNNNSLRLIKKFENDYVYEIR